LPETITNYKKWESTQFQAPAKAHKLLLDLKLSPIKKKSMFIIQETSRLYKSTTLLAIVLLNLSENGK
jgi:hypothetical protein